MTEKPITVLDISYIENSQYAFINESKFFDSSITHSWSYKNTNDDRQGFTVSKTRSEHRLFAWMIDIYAFGNECVDARVYFGKALNVVKLVTNDGTYTEPYYTKPWEEILAPVIRFIKSKYFGITDDDTLTVNSDIFEITDTVPNGYRIWNIGDNMPDGYLPLCQLKWIQPFEGAQEIDTHTLRAIPVANAQVILKAVGHGLNTLPKMRQYVRRFEKHKPSKRILPYINICNEAIAALENIEGAENLQG